MELLSVCLQKKCGRAIATLLSFGVMAAAPVVAAETTEKTVMTNHSSASVMANYSSSAIRAKHRWESNGILVERVSLSASGIMVDMRYRILDLEKAQKVLNKSTKLHMIDQKTGAILPVPDMAKIGKLRQLAKTNEPTRIYWMFFRNTGGIVRQGSKLTLSMGSVGIKDLVVE